jgi:ferric-dicitrate binding protein FerR (iron transport regulator)
MNIPRYAVAAARTLKRHLEQVPPPAGDRARALATIERAMAVRSRRRALLWTLAAAAAAAAALALWQGTSPASPHLAEGAWIQGYPLGSGAKVRASGREVPLLSQTAVEPGATIVTASDGGAALRLATRSTLELSGGTEVRVEGDEMVARFALRQGGFSAHVAKLSEGQRFIVETPDAEVEVRGTRFQLRVLGQPQACGSGSLSRLEVSEGVVEVRAAGVVSRVSAGQSWPVDCGAAGQTASKPAAESPATAAEPPVSAASGKAPARPTPAAPTTSTGQSGLTQQNDLFASGVALRRQGNLAGALRAYQELIAQFPNSPLAENAMVERMRLLSTTQRAPAKEEARRYLRRYPRGFAVQEAQHLLDEP